MATAKLPDTLAASLRHQYKRIDEMRASARMRARLMKKIPRPVEFPPGVLVVADPGPSQSFALVGGARAAAMGASSDARALDEPPSPPAGQSNRVA
jgi:hypothetical protein